ncbi:MAG: hypothetical protein QNL68_06945 [Akkermansiaceae bacterium]
MPMPRPLDPYQPPRKPEEPGKPLASAKKLSGGMIALIFFSPLMIAAVFILLVMILQSDMIFISGIWICIIAMIVVTGVTGVS